MRSTTKILHVCKVYLPTIGGIQMVVNKLVAGLSNEFVQQILTTSQDKELNHKQNETVLIAHSLMEIKSLPIAPSFIPKLWKKLSEIDLVCIHYPFPLSDITIALYPFKLPKLIIYWHSEIVSQKYLKLILTPFTKRLLNRADKIIVSSPHVIKYSKLLSEYDYKTVIIPFGIDPPIERHKTPNSKKGHLLSIGRHVEYKGFHILIQALHGTNNHLTIVGKGPLLNQHMELAKQLKIEHQLTFITEVSKKVLDTLLSGCYALVFPSTLPSEAFGLVQIEAMCYGKPIINTNLKSGVPWVARHLQEALTVPPNNISALTKAINKLTIDHELYKKLSEGSAARYQKTFTSTAFIKTTRSIYNQTLN